jgi:transcriptional regulator with GAF, ATPase, and Fis domain
VDIPFLEKFEATTLEPPSATPAFTGLVSDGGDSREPARQRALYERVPLKKAHVKQALENAAGIQTMAARNLGVSLRQLRYAVKKFNLDIKAFKS